jgi:hypothetical protein
MIATYGCGPGVLAITWLTLEEYFQINKRTLMRYVDFLVENKVINKRRGYRCVIFTLQDDKSVNLLNSKVTKVSSYSIQDDKKCHLTQTEVSSEKKEEGSYNVIGVVGEVGNRSNTDFRKVTLGVRSIVGVKENIGVVYMRPKKQKEVCMERKPKRAPPIPKEGIKVSEIVGEEHDFPYNKTAMHVSAIWYWAIQRYKKHKIDMAVTATTFRKLAQKYSQGVGKFLGKDWENHRKYIDWYLALNDNFVRKTCRYNENYMCSMTCYNKWENEPQEQGFFEPDDPERLTTGRWIREEIDIDD